MKIKKGDTVKVIAGKDKDKEGKVLAVNQENSTVVVEGVNMVTKHTKPSASKPAGRHYSSGRLRSMLPTLCIVQNGKATRSWLQGRRRQESPRC